MPNTSQNLLLLLLQRSLRKSASSALPAAPKVPNPAPQPLKTPSFTTKPPTVGKAVADVRPGLSDTVTPKTQSLGTAKATGAKQVSVSKPIMAPKEFKAIPTAPLAKTAQLVPDAGPAPVPRTYPVTAPSPQPKTREPQSAPTRMVTPQLRNPSFGSVNRVTGKPVYGHGAYSTARTQPVDQAARNRAVEAAANRMYAVVPDATPPKPENPHYANRPAQLQAQAARQRQEALEGYAKDDPTVVKRMTDAQVAEKMKGYTTAGAWLDRHPAIRGIIEAPIDKVKQVVPAARGVASSDWAHDSANAAEHYINRFQKGVDYLLSKGVKWVDPRSWGSSLSARMNRLSHDNDWENARRVYDARSEKLFDEMRTADHSDKLTRNIYDTIGAVGEAGGGLAATGGAGTMLKGVGNVAVRAGTGFGFRGGRLLGTLAQRLGASGTTAGAITRTGARIGRETGRALSAPVRYAGNTLYAPVRGAGTAVHSLAHPVQAARAVASGARTAGRFVTHPWQAVKSVSGGHPFSRALDAYMYGQNAYDVGQGVATGDLGRAAGSAVNTGLYSAGALTPGMLGHLLRWGPVAVPAAQMAFGGGDQAYEQEYE